MQIKKRYFVVALVLLLGLTTFSFANPLEKMDSKKTAKGISERVTNDKIEEHSYSEALEAVEEAEENPTVETVETARNEIRNANDATEEQITQLQNRVNVVEETIDVAALVTEVETLAEVKEKQSEARDKHAIAVTEVNKLAEGDVKENLESRLAKVLRLLNDTQAPTITGVTNGSIVNKSENVYVNDEFLENVKITGPNSKGEVVIKEFTQNDFTVDSENTNSTLKYKANYEGEWTVVATDKAGNTRTETFTIDRTAAKVEVSKSNNDKSTNKDVTVTLKTNEAIVAPEGWTVVTEGTEFTKVYSEKGKHTLTVKDLAGNETEVKFEVKRIDKVAPEATVTKSNNDKSTNQDVVVTIVANEAIYKPEGWTEVSTNKEHEFTKVYSENGKYEVEITDKAGNKSTIKFEVKRIDKVAPEGKVTTSNNNGQWSTNQDVVATLVTNEAIYKPEGWTEVSTNKEHEFTKVYSENGKYEVEITDKAGNKTTVKFEVKRIDKVAPVLTVVDPNKYQLEVHSEYVDKGYSAWDAVDKDVTNLVKITYQFQAKGTSSWQGVDKLDTSKVGTYKITYTAYDKAGNTAKGTRVVQIVDTTKPEFVSEAGYNENGLNPYVKVKDNTDISFKVYRKGTEEPIHEFSSTTTGKSFKIGWHGAGIYTIVATDAGGNESSIELEVYHNLNNVDAVANAFKNGGTAVLTQNMTLDTAVELAEGQKLEIDLNGYELKISNPENSSTRLIQNKGELTIKNGKLLNEKIYSYGIVDNYGTVTLDNVKVQDNGSFDGSSIKNRNGKVTITNSEFNITSSTGYKTTGADKDIKFGNTAVWNDGEFVIKDTKITGDSERAYALTNNTGTATIENVDAKGKHGGLGINGGTLEVNNMKYESDVHYGIYVSNKSEANITINGGEFIGQLQGLLINNEFDNADVKVTVNDGKFSSKTGKEAAKVITKHAKTGKEVTHKMDLIVKGGTFVNTKLPEKYIADGYVQNDEYTVVRNAISVTSAEQLKELFSNPTNIAGKTIVLEKDLDMTGIEWKAVDGVSFTLDGNKHTIKNLTYTTDGNIGIFVNHSAAKNLKFKDLTIDNANLTTTATAGHVAAGFFVGDADTVDSITIQNCTVKNSKINAYDYAGGFVGYTAGWNKVNDGPVYSDILIEDCSFLNNTITAGGSVGGAVAHAGGNPDTTVTVKNFKAENNVLNGETGRDKTGIVIGTAHVGKTVLEGITQSNNTVLGVEKSNVLYGRFVPNSTGTLTIDGKQITN